MTTMYRDQLSDHREAIEHCRFCPMCKPKGEVSLVTQHEVHTTRARAMLLWRVVAGYEPWSPRVAELVYEASLDSSSEHFCVGKIPVSSYILAARAEVVRQGLAPVRVVRQAQRLLECPPVGQLPPSDTVLYSDLDEPRPSLSNVLAELVPTIRMHEITTAHVLGLEDAFDARAGALHDAIRRSGARTIIADGPATHFALTELLPRGGYALDGLNVTTVTEVLRSAPRQVSGPPVYVHDSSYYRLARVEPSATRSLLDAWGVVAMEFMENGLMADDVGIEGALHLTHPELAAKVAQRRVRDLPSGSVVLTDCPTSAAWLNQSVGGGITAMVPDEYLETYGSPD